MAKFKTHITFGALIGLFSSIIISQITLSKNIITIFVSFTAVLLGSFLPDIDSDTSRTFKLIFNTLSLIVSALVLFYLIYSNVTDILFLILIPIASFLFVRYVIGYIFKKITHHRGIWHSIPYSVVVMLLTLIIADRFKASSIDKLIFSLSVGVGYLGHLILDEIYSFVNIGGIPFVPKKSLGSALKLYSNSKIATVIAFLLIIVLLYFSFPILVKVFT